MNGPSDLTIAVDWDIKNQTKQTWLNKLSCKVLCLQYMLTTSCLHNSADPDQTASEETI